MLSEMSVMVFSKAGKRKIAVLLSGQLVEYMEETADATSWVGRILLGTVQQVLPQLGAAFVKIGQRLNGFLPVKEQDSFNEINQGQGLKTGQDVLVQVKKDSVNEKGAFLTRDIALPGQYAVMMPNNRHIGVSGRVQEEADREAMIELGMALTKGSCGIIGRHAALFARQKAIEDEWEELQETWKGILQKAEYAKAPSVLYKEATALQAACRDFQGRYTLTVTTNEAFPEEWRVEAKTNWQQATNVEMEALWAGASVDRQVEEALGRYVFLKNGGSLVIDEREALTTIDVNTGRLVQAEGQSIAVAQNLAACAEIARQIRLRNLGGMILIDFVDMHNDEEREAVMAALSEELAKDRTKTVMHGFTRLGLLEMSRKRMRESLSQALTSPCSHCLQTGRSKSANANVKRKGLHT